MNLGIYLDDGVLKFWFKLLNCTQELGCLKILFRKKYFCDNDGNPKQVGFNIFKGNLTIPYTKPGHMVKESSLEGEETRRRVNIQKITGKKHLKTKIAGHRLIIK